MCKLSTSVPSTCTRSWLAPFLPATERPEVEHRRVEINSSVPEDPEMAAIVGKYQDLIGEQIAEFDVRAEGSGTAAMPTRPVDGRMDCGCGTRSAAALCSHGCSAQSRGCACGLWRHQYALCGSPTAVCCVLDKPGKLTASCATLQALRWTSPLGGPTPTWTPASTPCGAQSPTSVRTGHCCSLVQKTLVWLSGRSVKKIMV